MSGIQIKVRAPTHQEFQKNRDMGAFLAKHPVVSRHAGGIGSGGTSHYPAPKDSTNSATVPDAREKLTGLSLDHHR